MKQYILNWLSFSIVLLLLFSCKKKTKDVLDDFPPGKFNFVWAWNQNGAQDTVTGEVSGPYPLGDSYFFRRNLILQENELPFELNRSSDRSTLREFRIYKTVYKGKILDYQVDVDNIYVSYSSGDTLTGTFKLTRK